MGRLTTWGNDNPWKMWGGLTLLVILVMVFALRLEASQRADEIAKEAKVRAEQIAASAQETCEDAVVAVTEQSKDDDLAIIKLATDRIAELGRPVPQIYKTLNASIAARRPPVEACAPQTTNP